MVRSIKILGYTLPTIFLLAEKEKTLRNEIKELKSELKNLKDSISYLRDDIRRLESQNDWI